MKHKYQVLTVVSAAIIAFSLGNPLVARADTVTDEGEVNGDGVTSEIQEDATTGDEVAEEIAEEEATDEADAVAEEDVAGEEDAVEEGEADEATEETVDEEEAEEVAGEEQAEEEDDSRPWYKKYWWVLICPAVLLFFGLGVGIYYLVNWMKDRK